MGINVGAWIAPLICGWLAQSETFRGMLADWGMKPETAWHWGFAAAAVGMFFGLVQYQLTGKSLGEAGLLPANAGSPEKIAAAKASLRRWLVVVGLLIAALIALFRGAPEMMSEENISNGFGVMLIGVVVFFFIRLFGSGDWSPEERKRLVLVPVLFAGAAIFWGLFEQAGSTLSLFAERSTDNQVFGRTFPSSWWQSMNAMMIIILAPAFAWLWVTLGKKNPSSPAKFSVGLLFAGLGFLVLVGGASVAGDTGCLRSISSTPSASSA